jgi:hypothetical protein
VNDLLAWLQEYYLAQCNGDWEHQYGLHIDNVDNPGWCVKFDLEDTDMEGVPFDRIKEQRSKHDWIICDVENKAFRGSGGPQNLIEILTVFRNWVQSKNARTNPAASR